MVRKIKKHSLRILSSVILTLLSHQMSFANECSEYLNGKNISIVVSTGPGGGYDLMARLIGSSLERAGAARVIVRNLPGGRGSIARQYLLAPKDNEITLGYFNLNELSDNEDKNQFQDYSALAGVIESKNVWVGRSDYDLLKDAKSGLIISNNYMTPRGIATDGIAPDLLDFKPKYLLGLNDSSQIVGAILRREIDVAALEDTVALRVMKSGGVKVLFTFTREPVAEFPDTPFLGGDNGIVAKITANLTQDEKEKRLKLADQIIDLMRPVRAIHISSKAPEDLKICIENSMLQILRDPKFQAESEKASFKIAPKSRVELDAIFQTYRRAAEELATLLDEKKKIILGQ